MRMTRKKSPSNHFPKALQRLRLARRLSQEDFSLVSSRTYVSSLERGIYSPTLAKVDQLAEVLGVHPLALLTLSYMDASRAGSEKDLFAQVIEDLTALSKHVD